MKHKKAGFDPRDTKKIISDIEEIKGVSIVGVIGMVTNTDDAELIREQLRVGSVLFDI